ncbi:ABC transporter permease [Aeromonas veronii]|uniref:ABC transporter permease n=1 Tax=Aeromonas veronii TaxID=654 RepID=UPI0038D313E6
MCSTQNSIFPSSIFKSVWRYRQLIGTMAYREIIGRYRGSIIGLAWSFFNPLLMLAIYTFVFSIVFKAKWNSDLGGGQGEFAVILFTGMIIFNIFSECICRAPTLIVSNANYVKKIVFPLEVLPWVILGNAMFHGAISIFVLCVAQLLVFHAIPWTFLLLPVIMVPFLFGIIGACWILAAVGAYLRDLSQIIGVLITVLMFTSPLFFPLSALPEHLQPFLMLNPLSYFIEETRAIVIFGKLPSCYGLVIAYVASFIIAYIGYAFFQKVRKGFADVI